MTALYHTYRARSNSCLPALIELHLRALPDTYIGPLDRANATHRPSQWAL